MRELKWVAFRFLEGETIIATQCGTKFISWQKLDRSPVNFRDVTRRSSPRALARELADAAWVALASQRETPENLASYEFLLFQLPDDLDLWPEGGISAIMSRGSQTYFRLSYHLDSDMFRLTRVKMVMATKEMKPLR